MAFKSIKLWSWRKHGANRICTVARLPRTEGTKPWLCNEFHEGTSLFLHLSHLCIPHNLLLHLLQSGMRCIDDKYSPSRRASNWSDSFWFHPEKGKQSEEKNTFWYILSFTLLGAAELLPLRKPGLNMHDVTVWAYAKIYQNPTLVEYCWIMSSRTGFFDVLHWFGLISWVLWPWRGLSLAALGTNHGMRTSWLTSLNHPELENARN